MENVCLVSWAKDRLRNKWLLKIGWVGENIVKECVNSVLRLLDKHLIAFTFLCVRSTTVIILELFYNSAFTRTMWSTYDFDEIFVFGKDGNVKSSTRVWNWIMARLLEKRFQFSLHTWIISGFDNEIRVFSLDLDWCLVT